MRSLIVAGQGIRLAGEVQAFRKAAEEHYVVTTWLGADLLPTDHPHNLGIIGPCGQQRANRALHAADDIYLWGTSWGIGHVGAVPPKGKTQAVSGAKPPHPGDGSYSSLPPDPELIFGSYGFNNEMTRLLPEGTVMVVDGGGTALYTGFQSSHIKEGSRLICSAAMSAMGSGLPEAVGACFANAKKLTTCIIGDGSLMLNVQELQTIATHKLPIKIFVVNNGGYLAIRQTQRDFQEGRYYGVGGADLEFPNLVRIAYAFGIPYCGGHTVDALAHEGPVLCEWRCDPDQPMLRQGFKDGKALPLTEMVIA